MICIPVIPTTHPAVPLLLSERSQAEMSLTERSIMIKKDPKTRQFVLSAWFYQNVTSLGKTQELKWKPYNKQSAWAAQPQGWLRIFWENPGRNVEEGAASPLPGQPIIAAFTSSLRAQLLHPNL